ncbi:hypothetical protein Ciccas_009635 [Cichlidogyrus casuarinus]|uniref:Alkaline phosphatase n=1 Tax=Cichlidogyrus casuarinus TaxID=1844966 RepID=A0ABD2PWI0_9PLAT
MKKVVIPLLLLLAVSNIDACENYFDLARSDLLRQINLLPKGANAEKQPKNIILMMGDGMGYSTLTMARYKKALNEGKLAGDSTLNIDSFPYSGSIRTFCADNIVTDSGASATAYLTGCKANKECIGVSPQVTNDPDSYHPQYDGPNSFLIEAKLAGFLTGFATTQPITHASPAPLYAHTHSRRYEYLAKCVFIEMFYRFSPKPLVNKNGLLCLDIASQFVQKSHYFDLVMGGGRGYFQPIELDKQGLRGDGRNLLNEWMNECSRSNQSCALYQSPADFLAKRQEAFSKQRILGK